MRSLNRVWGSYQAQGAHDGGTDLRATVRHTGTVSEVRILPLSAILIVKLLALNNERTSATSTPGAVLNYART